MQRTPKGHLNVLTRTLRRHARYGDVAGFRAFVGSDEFVRLFVGAAQNPIYRRPAMLVYAEAEALCEAKARMPLGKPRSVADGVRSQHANWRDPAMQAKLRAATSDEMAARMCGVTVKAALLARRRYLGAAATPMLAKAA